MAHTKNLPLMGLLLLGVSGPAFAQTPATTTPAPAANPAAAAPAQSREVVIITANKREEDVQDTALAITAVSAQTRDTVGIQSITDLANFTPGLQFTTANDRIILRGVGRNTNNFGAEPGVANYTDGVYQSFAQIAGRAPLFIERTEVLRGPQGTLYGRNSIGGALNIISKRPTDNPYAEVRVGWGNYDSYKVQAAASGQILGPALRGRIAVDYDVNQDGFLKNTSGLQNEGGRADNYLTEIQFDGKVGSNFDWWFKFDFGGYHNLGPPGGRTDVGSISPYDTRFAASGAIVPNASFAYSTPCTVGQTTPCVLSYTQVGNQTTNPALDDPRKFNANRSRVADLNGYRDYAFQANYHAPAFDVKYVGGYIWYKYDLTGDNDGTPVQSITYRNSAAGAPITIYPDTDFFYGENRAFFSNEVNFISTYDGPLQWVAGLYAYQENFRQEPLTSHWQNQPDVATNILDTTKTALIGAAPASSYLAPNNPDRLLSKDITTGVNNSYGAYAQFDYSITDKLKTTVGLRYSQDVKNMQERARLFCYLVCGTVGAVPTPFVPFAIPQINTFDITTASWSGQIRDSSGSLIAQKGVALGDTETIIDAQGFHYRKLQDSWKAVTGTAGLDYKPDQDALFFVKYSRGYKTGGFNAQAMSPNPETNPEHIDSYEFGWKQDWRALRLQTNISAYYYDYQDVQTPITVVPSTGVAFTAFINIPTVHTKGFEVETNWQPIDNATILFNYAYTDPQIKNGCCYVDGTDPFGTQPGVKSGTVASDRSVGQNVAGNILPFSSHNKVSVNARYAFRDVLGGTVTPSVTYSWKDKFYSSIFNRAYNASKAYGQTDLRLLWDSNDRKYTIIGYVRNAFDEDGYDGVGGGLRRNTGTAFSATTPGTIYTTPTLTYPRTFGAEFQVRF